MKKYKKYKKYRNIFRILSIEHTKSNFNMLSNLCVKISKTTVKKQNKVEFKGFNPVAAKDEISRPEDLTCLYDPGS